MGALDLRETVGQGWTDMEWMGTFLLIEQLFLVLFPWGQPIHIRHSQGCEACPRQDGLPFQACARKTAITISKAAKHTSTPLLLQLFCCSPQLPCLALPGAHVIMLWKKIYLFH